MSDSKEKMTIVLDSKIMELLREYAYLENIKSRNWAVTEIVTDFISEWSERR